MKSEDKYELQRLTTIKNLEEKLSDYYGLVINLNYDDRQIMSMNFTIGKSCSDYRYKLEFIYDENYYSIYDEFDYIISGINNQYNKMKKEKEQYNYCYDEIFEKNK